MLISRKNNTYIPVNLLTDYNIPLKTIMNGVYSNQGTPDRPWYMREYGNERYILWDSIPKESLKKQPSKNELFEVALVKNSKCDKEQETKRLQEAFDVLHHAKNDGFT